MVSKPQIFMGVTYKSLDAFEKYIKNIINGIGKCADIRTTFPDKYVILVELLNRHPNDDKIQRMVNLKLIANYMKPQFLELIVIRDDNTEESISYNAAIKGEWATHEKNLLTAMRSGVEDQILYFGQTNERKCVLCNSTTNLHIDHNTTTFANLVKDFLANNNTPTPARFGKTADDTNRVAFLSSDSEFRDEWAAYHENHADLRVLCQTCNLTRPRST